MARRSSISSFAAPLDAAPPKENAETLNRMIEEDIKVCSHSDAESHLRSMICLFSRRITLGARKRGREKSKVRFFAQAPVTREDENASSDAPWPGRVW